MSGRGGERFTHAEIKFNVIYGEVKGIGKKIKKRTYFSIVLS